MTNYDDLALVPSIVAASVADEPYMGSELSEKVRPDAMKVETLRRKMTPEQKAEFAALCDDRCRAAYRSKAPWFYRCLIGNRGRDRLYNWMSHWLVSYLNDPAVFRVRSESKRYVTVKITVERLEELRKKRDSEVEELGFDPNSITAACRYDED